MPEREEAMAQLPLPGARCASFLADEPTGNVDSKHGQEVLMILHGIVRDEGRSVLVVTHDPRVEDVADRLLWLKDGALRDRKAEPHAWVRDPVCGVRVDEWTAEVVVERGGHRYVFCSRRCLERFEKEPDRYARGARDVAGHRETSCDACMFGSRELDPLARTRGERTVSTVVHAAVK